MPENEMTFPTKSCEIIFVKFFGRVFMEWDEINAQKLIENINVAVVALEEILGKPYNQIADKMHLAPTMGSSVKIAYTKAE